MKKVDENDYLVDFQLGFRLIPFLPQSTKCAANFAYSVVDFGVNICAAGGGAAQVSKVLSCSEYSSIHLDLRLMVLVSWGRDTNRYIISVFLMLMVMPSS